MLHAGNCRQVVFAVFCRCLQFGQFLRVCFFFLFSFLLCPERAIERVPLSTLLIFPEKKSPGSAPKSPPKSLGTCYFCNGQIIIAVHFQNVLTDSNMQIQSEFLNRR